MKRIAAALAIALAPVVAAAQIVDPKKLPPASSEHWLNVNKTSNGYIFAGKLGSEIWAFHVRGLELRKFPEAPAPTYSIDGVVLQVRPVHRGAFALDGRNVLDAHRKQEQELQQKRTRGAIQFSDTQLCAAAKLPHREWLARPSGAENPPRAYLTFEVGEYVLMIVAPYENEVRSRSVARAIGEICDSFSREKA